jgi:hypothetical protein
MVGKHNLYIEMHHVDAASRAALKNSKKGAIDESYTLTDRGHRGLALRLRGGKVSWMVKTTKVSKVIGYAHPKTHPWAIKGIIEAKEIAGHVQAMIRNGEEALVDDYLSNRHSLKDHDKAVSAVRPVAETWTFRTCLEETLKERSDASAQRPLRPRSVDEYRHTFSRPILQPLLEKPVASITRGEIETLRKAIKDKHGIRPSEKLLTNFRSVMDHVAAFHSMEAGLETVEPWWRMLSSPFGVRPRTRRPTIQEIVKTLLIAEEYSTKPFPGRYNKKVGVAPSALAGLWWLALTAQRAQAGLMLKSYDFNADTMPGREGWMLAAWDGSVMKNRQTHVLPIPPRASAKIQEHLAKCKYVGRSDWAFPSSTNPDKPTHKSVINNVMKRMAMKDQKRTKTKSTDDAPARKDTRVDLFSERGILWWSPHDIRRTLLQRMDELGMPGGASAIMAHEIKLSQSLDDERMTMLQREEFRRQRAARITLMAYGGAQHINLKSTAMTAWTDSILDAYEEEKARQMAWGDAA